MKTTKFVGPFTAVVDNYANDGSWVVLDGLSITVAEGLTEDEARAYAIELEKEEAKEV